ncbi:sensor histidine kinase [Glutamicibacter sp. 0426]|uniref:sensor histidine kinase n=1 Tax=Glutamicibacter sp. 0426 TaxID=1913445 RepID=UPI0009401877|nr:histidine kinase [Glutamicibacter sp. 0426]
MSTRRRPPLAILPVAVAVIQLAGTHFASMHQGRTLPLAAILLLLAGPALLLLRRRAPGPMAAGAAAIALAYLAAGFPFGPFLASLLVALVIAVVTGARWWAWGAAIVFGAGAWLLAAQLAEQRIYLLLAWLVVLLLIGELAKAGRNRREDRRKAEAERRRHERDEERLVLARDIHDVVAHSLSMINVQASVALHLAQKDPDPDQLIEALGNIKSGSSHALAEVREVLSVLRHDAPRIPSQRIAQLPELVSRVSSGELSVKYEAPDLLPVWLDERAENTIYRAVQESLTNIVRHAHATRAAITFAADDTQAEVTIADDGIGMAAAEEGNGLRGLRERVQQLGGTVSLGPANLAGAAHPGTAITVRIPSPQEAS